MKNKGFTIIELLIIIVIIGILATLTTVVITKYIAKGHEKYYNSLENEIELAAKDYFSENVNELPRGEIDELTGYKIIAKKLELTSLSTKNYLTNDVVDVNNNPCVGSYIITEYDVTKQTYNYHVCLICNGKNINNNVSCNIDSYYKPNCNASVTDYAKGQKKITIVKNNVNSTITPVNQKGILSSEKVDNFTSSYIVNLNGNYTFNTSLNEQINSCSAKVTGCDNEPPVILTSVTGGKNTANINATITDNVGVTGYAITKDTTIPTVWTNITSILSVTTTFTETSVGTYYIHATDESGNTSYKQVSLSLTSNPNCPCSNYVYEYACNCDTCGGGCNSWKNKCTGGYYTDCRPNPNYPGCLNPDTGCFLKGTKVLVKDGYTNIEDIKVGDKVVTYNTNLNKNEINTVTKKLVHTNYTDELYELTINGKILKVTSAHRFYVMTKTKTEFEWLAVRHLQVGDKVLDSNGILHKIANIKYYLITDTVYNFEVENNQNYYVTKERYLVHNGGKVSKACEDKCYGKPNQASCFANCNLSNNEENYQFDNLITTPNSEKTNMELLSCNAEICKTWVPRTCNDVCTGYSSSYPCNCDTCGGYCQSYSVCWLN